MSERDVLFDISRRLTDDEIRAIFLSPMVSTTETLAAVSLRFEVTRARREEEDLRAENERLREAAEMVCERLAGVGGDYYREIAPGLMDDIEALQRALAAPPGEK